MSERGEVVGVSHKYYAGVSHRHIIIINAIVANAKSVQKFLSKRDLSSLSLNAKHHIVEMHFVSIQFGRCVVVDLKVTGRAYPQPGDDKTFFVNLLKRWVFTEKHLQKVKPYAMSLSVHMTS